MSFDIEKFCSSEDELKIMVKEKKISKKELIDILFLRYRVEDKDMYGKWVIHRRVDKDSGAAWVELIVKEKFPEFFFKEIKI